MSASNDQVERVLKVAKSGFFEAIDYLSCIAILEAGNDVVIDAAIGKAGAGRSAELIQKALFHRLLISVMIAFDPPRDGDYHLKVGMDLLSDQKTFNAVVKRGGSSDDLNAARQAWGECLAEPSLKNLRDYRNKIAAHLSDILPGMKEPLIGELLTLAKKTAVAGEKLAHGAGITKLSLDSQIQPHTESAKIFWQHWRTSSEAKLPSKNVGPS